MKRPGCGFNSSASVAHQQSAHHPPERLILFFSRFNYCKLTTVDWRAVCTQTHLLSQEAVNAAA